MKTTDRIILGALAVLCLALVAKAHAATPAEAAPTATLAIAPDCPR